MSLRQSGGSERGAGAEGESSCEGGGRGDGDGSCRGCWSRILRVFTSRRWGIADGFFWGKMGEIKPADGLDAQGFGGDAARYHSAQLGGFQMWGPTAPSVLSPVSRPQEKGF